MNYNIEVIKELNLGSAIGQCRALPVNITAGKKGILVIYGADFDVDPYIEMFFFPKDTLKMVLLDQDFNILWRKDLGEGAIPGIWFCPVYPFDLDQDGSDEIFFVRSSNPQHPLSKNSRVLERLSLEDGQTTGSWKWVNKQDLDLGVQWMGPMFRDFVFGGYVHGQPVLITGNGTYGDMYLQGFNPDMSQRWEYLIRKETPGARGSHMCPVVDINHDGIDEFFWGERCIEIDSGRELWCGDKDTYNGHSDVIQPVIDDVSGQWSVFTCRESNNTGGPRVVLFNAKGNRHWAKLEQGHMDMGFTARWKRSGSFIGATVKVDGKSCGPDGRYHENYESFAYSLPAGEDIILPFDPYKVLPVDLDGDGFHEFVQGAPSGSGKVFDSTGKEIADLAAPVALLCKFMDHPGEQLLAYYPDGTLRVWADLNASDSPAAMKRYASPFYQAGCRLFAAGYNLNVLGGI